ncbi:MAG: nitrogenase component 1 [Clostridia bacterium]
MKDNFYEELSIAMYPSSLLHTFGVNGKISGSIGAVGEMQDVLPIIHGPRGCGFHYRHSARRRHQPLYRVLTTNLEERDIIGGGEEKLRRTVEEAWRQYHPKLIMVIPSPISDILNDDILTIVQEMRGQGIPVVGIQSELFSHRDKNYTRNRLKKIAEQKITGENRLEMEIKGCGFVEALYALVGQVMEAVPVIPHSVNIETVGWGSNGNLVLREIEAFLNRCGITVNTWFPSASYEAIRRAPAAQLNLARRVRWARLMKERFGTDYLHLGSEGRYSGLEGFVPFTGT